MLSIDVMRGLTIAFMIIVNAQAGPAPFHALQHAAWNGFTPTDLVFPTFLFVVGISIVLSTASRLARGGSKAELLWHTARRAVILIALGFVVNNFPLFHMATARYYGVLPRIGLCYFIVAALYIWKQTWKDKAVIAALCLVGYWVLMCFVPIPGLGQPGRDFPINDPNLNMTAWLDRHIFSAPHLYERVRDPEGLLSTIPSLATTLFGVLAGIWLRSTHTIQEKAAGIAIAGTSFVLMGAVWNFIFPINKKLWTSSFALYAGGWSMIILALAVYIVDVRRVGRGAEDAPEHPALYKPLLVFGTNAITAYMFAELLASVLFTIRSASGNLWKSCFNAVFSVVSSTQWASLVQSLLFMLVCWLVVYPLYRKRIFLKI